MSYALNKISHLRIPYEDHIESATDDMDDENIISENDECVSYRGQLLWSGELIDIVAQEYDRHLSEGISKFEANALILSGLKHKNIVSFVGFCEDPYWVIIVTKYEVNKSLDMYLSDSRSLSWMKRLQICVGVAHGLSYLHYEEGRDYSVIHCNIKSSSILLDENWEPKITFFGNSIRTPVAQRHRLLHAKHSGTVGYMDAIYEKTKGVTHKVDVFSFGVVLFEVLFGWEASSPNEENESLVQSAKFHYEKGTLEDMISTDLREEMDDQSFNIFSETAYCCLKEQRAQRPNMDQIVKRLEKALELQKKFENHEHSRDASEGTSMDRLKGNDFEHLKIKLSDLEFATEEFSEKFCIGSGGYGKVYKARLQFDGKSYSKIEEKNEGEFPNKDKTVAIKRIFSRADKQGEDGFIAEIEMLSSFLFEILCGRVAYDPIYLEEDVKGLGPIARRRFQEGTLKEMRDPNLTEESDEIFFTQNRGLNEDSLATFSEIAYKCLAETQAERPTMEVVIEELKKALSFQENQTDNLKFSLEDIKLATENFSNSLGEEECWGIYKGERIALQCLHDKREERPTAGEVLIQLKKALEFQEDYEMWEPKLPKDYKEIILMSKTPDVYSMSKKKDIYNMLLKGILVQEGNVWFSIGKNGGRNEMLSARNFSYKNRWSRKRRYVPQSRFHKAAEMLDISNLNIQIKIKPQFLSPDVNYGVYLVFRFSGPTKSKVKRIVFKDAIVKAVSSILKALSFEPLIM
ncbi:unnamed protein product [Lactuca virosa]|uniref:Protein kinase domain-containing protein n=1 Tax=Lactuca virosa TaxID=75947 RepID=A0AAU9MNG5_9ASTR|nr:unnamed protein product [Lactuca virosa]